MKTAMKDDFLASLLTVSSGRQSGGKLVDEIRDGESVVADEWNVAKPPVSEEPSMMELMMAAHSEAKAEILSVEKENTKAVTTSIGSGFKKGFFGQGSSKKLPTTKVSKVPDVAMKEIPVSKKPITIKASTVSGASGAAASISADVQTAISEGEPQILKQLKQGEWVTPALLAVFQENKIIRNGLGNHKCSQALQLMQTDPKEAKKRFEGDPEVELFMSEFGKVMSSHFSQLGADQERNKQNNTSRTPKSALQSEPSINTSSMGILQAEAVERDRVMKASGGKDTRLVVDRSVKGDDGFTDEERDKRVQEVVSDGELSSLLLDPAFQQTLKECNDPMMYSMHMRNPVTARKIKLMFNAGLVATVK